jgi:hypothetical protein
MSKRTLLDARPYYGKEKSLSIKKHKGGLRVADKPNRKVMIGTVSSSKMDKTITVSIETVKQHPLYKKTIKTSKKYKAHDENNSVYSRSAYQFESQSRIIPILKPLG